MENLNAEQIKKALECCTKFCGCDNCPFEPKGDCYKGSMACGNELMKNALALITSQEQRIAELTEEIERLRAETIKEFAKRAKASLETFGEQHHYQCKRIDQIEKEMLEGDNEN